MREIEQKIRLEEADNMPLERATAYVTSWAISNGYHGRFSWGSTNGEVYVTIYKND